jgi:hypothetical protein
VAAAGGAGPRPLLRLSRTEYLNTVRDLLGVDPGPLEAMLPADTEDGSTGFMLGGVVTRVELDRFMEAAEVVGQSVPGKLASLLPCQPAGKEDACARDFVAAFGRRAYRRPLAPAEIDGLQAHYARARKELGLDFPNAVRVVVQTMLSSPHFLYHWERGAVPAVVEGGLVRLSPWEVASRLSYFLWGTMPDEELFNAAEAGKLGAVAGIQAQARRLLASPRAWDAVRTFHLQWLGLTDLASMSKDTKIFKDFRASLVESMGKETEAFLRATFFDGGDGKLSTLLTAPHAYVDERLAKHYGLAGVTGAQFRKVDLDPMQRAGVLTQAAFLSQHALANAGSPVKRGHFVRERLLCDRVPLAPANVEVNPPKPDPKKQTRELYAEHVQDPGCAGCHALMDPLGFAFEVYDGVGLFRREEAGRPIDATGTATLRSGATVRFDGAPDLVRKLLPTAEVEECLARSWLRFGLGRFEDEAEAGSVAAARQAFSAAGRDVRELVLAVVETKAFLYRAPAEGEVLQ